MSASPPGRLADFPPAYFVAALLLMLALHFFVPMGQWNVGMTRWSGLAPVLVGVVLLGSSVRRFGAATTIRPFEKSTELVTDGCYRFTRNPMYLGLVLSLIGAAVMLGSLTPPLVVVAFVAVIRSRFIAREEAGLQEQFGEDFRNYAKRVRRWL